MKTLIRHLLVAWLCCAYWSAPAQSVIREDSAVVPFAQMMDSIYEHVDLTVLSSHHLLSRAPVLVPIGQYDGSSGADTLDFKTWQSIYASLYLAATDAAHQLPEPETGYGQLHATLSDTAAIPLAVLHHDYHVLDSLALADSLLTLDGVQLYDVVGRPRSPWLPGHVTAMAPARHQVKGGTVQLKLDPAWWYEGTGLTLTGLSLDAGDGRGLQTVSLGETYTIAYLEGGRKPLHLRSTWSDGSVRHAYSYLEVEMTGATYRYSQAVNHKFTRTATRDGVTGSALVHITYGCGNSELRRPWIYVEGFQPTMLPNQDKTFESFIDDDAGRLPQDLQEDFENGGYDLVYVDFGDDGAESPFLHAELVKEVLDTINHHLKVGDEPNVIIGGSMGGISSLIALAEMEDAGEDTETRLLIPFDTGFQGANIPLGLQELFRHLTDNLVFGLVPGLQGAQEALESPAARSMLIYQAFPSNGDNFNPPERAALQAALNGFRAQGLPANTEVLPISNGSQIGEGQEFGPGDKFGDLQANLWIPFTVIYTNARFRMWAVPDDVANARIYKGSWWQTIFTVPIPVIMPRTVRVPAGTLPFDSSPGGGFLVDELLANGNASGLVSVLNFLPFNQVSAANRVCFVPTVSGLDLQPVPFVNLDLDVQAANVVANGVIPFDDYTAPNAVVDPALNLFNEGHVEWTGHATDFIRRRLVGHNGLANAAGTGPFALSTSYNFGRGPLDATVNQLTRSVDIQSHGHLKVNAAEPLGFPTDNLETATSQDFHLQVIGETDCFGAVTVQVASGGQLEVGDGSPARRAEVRFRSGSQLILDGGTLRIHDHSTLIIERGATLRLNAGHSIELLGDDAVLEIRGTLEIEESLTFTGAGFIRLGLPYSLPGVDGNVRLLGSGLHSIYLAGSGPQDKVLEIMPFTQLVAVVPS